VSEHDEGTNEAVVAVVADVGHVLQQHRADGFLGARWSAGVPGVGPGVARSARRQGGLHGVQADIGAVGCADVVGHQIGVHGDVSGDGPLSLDWNFRGERLGGYPGRQVAPEVDHDLLAFAAPQHQRLDRQVRVDLHGYRTSSRRLNRIEPIHQAVRVDEIVVTVFEPHRFGGDPECALG
jgi:hypothetical protein